MKKIMTIMVLLALVACKTTKDPQAQTEEQEQPAYSILYEVNMPEQIMFTNQSSGGSAIQLDYRPVGTQVRVVRNIKMVNMELGPDSAPIVGKQNIDFPFWGKITYQSNEGEAEMEFKIFEKGFWVISMTTLTP